MKPSVPARQILIAIILVILATRAGGQSFNKRLILNINYFTGSCTGSKDLICQNASFPKLFSNYEKLRGTNISAVYMINDHIGSGLALNVLNLNEWHHPDVIDYNFSDASIKSLSPVLYVQSSAILNTFRIFIQTGPSLSMTEVNLKVPVFYFENSEGGSPDPLLSVMEIKTGFGLNAGTLISVYDIAGISVSGSWKILKTNSVLYPDTRISMFWLQAGLTVRLLKNKRYYYK